MAGSGAASRARGARRKKAKPGAAAERPAGRPARLAHLVPGSDGQLRRERARLAQETEPLRSLQARPDQRRRSPSAPAPPGASPDVLCLPHPDWLPHELTVAGPPEALAAFRRAAAGPGTIPWIVDHQRLEEDWVHQLLTPPPAERGISVEGARVLARRLRELAEARDADAGRGAVGEGCCPFDLHALVPVPDRVLRLGPDDPAAIAWLWESWGTTWALRGLAKIADEPGQADALDGRGTIAYRFWSADWTPWRAIATLRARWPALSIAVRTLGVGE